MVAYLFETHQKAQYRTLAADAFGVFKRGRQFLHCTLIKRCLARTQVAPGLEFGLVRQVVDHPLVGLQPTQNVGPYERAQRAEVLGLCEPPGEVGEDLVRPQQTGVGEIEDGPKIGQAVFYRGSSQRDARLRMELLDLSRLLGARIFDRLRFIDAQQRAIGWS